MRMAQQTTLIPLAARTSTLIVDSNLDLGAFALKSRQIDIEELVTVNGDIQLDGDMLVKGWVEHRLKTYDFTVDASDNALTTPVTKQDVIVEKVYTKVAELTLPLTQIDGVPEESTYRLKFKIVGPQSQKRLKLTKDGVDYKVSDLILDNNINSLDIENTLQTLYEVWVVVSSDASPSSLVDFTVCGDITYHPIDDDADCIITVE